MRMVSNFPQTWDDIDTLNEIKWPLEEIRIIKDLEKKSDLPRCPALKTIGDYFFYCGNRVPGEVDKKADPFNPVYVARTDSLVMQMWCRGNFESCMYYKK